MRTRAAVLAWLVALLAVLGPGAGLAWATPRARPPAAPAGPPDPRRGENLDGRKAYVDPHRGQLALPRVVLAVPKYTLAILFFPVVELAAHAEKNYWYPRTYWTLTSDDRLVKVRPIIQYDTSFLPSIGLRYDDRRTLGEGSRLVLEARTAGPTLVSAEGRIRPAASLGLPVELQVFFERREDAIFAGIDGLDTDELEDAGRHAARYRYTRGTTSLLYETPLGLDWLSLKLQGDLDLRTYGDGSSTSSDPAILDAWCVVPGTSCDFVDPALVPGFTEGMRIVDATAIVRVDTRKQERFQRGVLAGVGATYAHGLFEDDLQFVRVAAGAGYTFGGTSRALSLRLRGGIVDGLDGTDVPFEMLWSPSGSDGVRGVPYGELLGASAAVGTIEYRWLVAPWLDATLFVDYGGASPLWFDDFLDHLVPSYGFGLWAYGGYQNEHWLAKPWGSLQVAVAPNEGWRLLFNVDSDFLW